MCSGNTVGEVSFTCPSPSTLKPAAASIRAEPYEATTCCEVKGQCTGNTNQAAEPDTICLAPSVLVDNSHQTAARGDACCKCEAGVTLVDSYCVATTDPRVDADNVCTRAMEYAGCGDDTLLCARNESASGCARCVEQPPYLTFQLMATAQSCAIEKEGQLTAQELCLAADPYGCTYDVHQARQVCEPKAWAPTAGMCTGNDYEADVICAEGTWLVADSDSALRDSERMHQGGQVSPSDSHVTAANADWSPTLSVAESQGACCVDGISASNTECTCTAGGMFAPSSPPPEAPISPDHVVYLGLVRATTAHSTARAVQMA
jgi:hypothetical protein